MYRAHAKATVLPDGRAVSSDNVLDLRLTVSARDGRRRRGWHQTPSSFRSKLLACFLGGTDVFRGHQKVTHADTTSAW